VIEKYAIAFTVIIFMLPIALASNEGYSKTAKIGFVISAIGCAAINFCPYMIEKIVLHEIEDIEKEIYSNNRDWLKNTASVVFRFGFIACIIGAGIVFVESTAKLFKKRKSIFPFLYKDSSVDKQ
jgi:hypothetical protein